MTHKIHYKIAVFLLLIPFIALANSTTDIKTERKKTIKKTFNVSKDATLKINNSFGNLDIVTWDENRIEFDITIKVSGNNAEKVQEKLDGISVKFSSTNDLVTAITNISKNKKNWWNWGNKMSLKLEINYRVKMPITNHVKLSNDYGGINLDKLEGKAELHCDYGKITTKELMADDNSINFDYSNNCYFEYIKSGSINADYSGFTVAKAKNLKLNADYTKSIIEAAEDVNYNCDYGALKIENINNLNGNGDYLTLLINNVYKNLNLKADYGSIKIERIASNANNITIDSEFTGIIIGHDENYNFNFDLDLEYGSLRASDGFNFINKEIDSFEKHYSGYFGKKDSGNTVKIITEYGSITFKKLEAKN